MEEQFVPVGIFWQFSLLDQSFDLEDLVNRSKGVTESHNSNQEDKGEGRHVDDTLGDHSDKPAEGANCS